MLPIIPSFLSKINLLQRLATGILNTIASTKNTPYSDINIKAVSENNPSELIPNIFPINFVASLRDSDLNNTHPKLIKNKVYICLKIECLT